MYSSFGGHVGIVRIERLLRPQQSRIKKDEKNPDDGPHNHILRSTSVRNRSYSDCVGLRRTNGTDTELPVLQKFGVYPPRALRADPTAGTSCILPGIGLPQQRRPVKNECNRAWFGFLNDGVHEKPVAVIKRDILPAPGVFTQLGRLEKKLRPGS